MNDQDILGLELARQCIGKLLAHHVIELAIPWTETDVAGPMQLIMDAFREREERRIRNADDHPLHGEIKLPHQRNDTGQTLGDAASLACRTDDPDRAARQSWHGRSSGRLESRHLRSQVVVLGVISQAVAWLNFDALDQCSQSALPSPLHAPCTHARPQEKKL
jgi:hypothetical protein